MSSTPSAEGGPAPALETLNLIPLAVDPLNPIFSRTTRAPQGARGARVDASISTRRDHPRRGGLRRSGRAARQGLECSDMLGTELPVWFASGFVHAC